MKKNPIIKKISCLTAGILIFWSPVLFMACSKAPQPAVSHASLDHDLRETSLEKEIRSVMEKGISLE